MNNDSIFGERLKIERKRLKLSQSAAGELAGVSREMWYKYEKGAMPGGEVMLAIERAGFNIEYLFTSKESSEPKIDSAKSLHTSASPDGFILVPHYEVQASAGHGALVHSEQIVDYLAFKADWVRNTLGVAQNDLALISVKGDSMEPTLSNEDLILIDMRKSRVEDNAIYVLQLDGTLLVKRIQRKLDGTLHVMSDNPRYAPEIVGMDRSAALNVLGRVVWSGRRM